MNKTLLIGSALLLTTTFAKASDWPGWYLGISANGGVLYDPNGAYFPSMRGYAEYGLNTTILLTNVIGISGGIMASNFNYDITYSRGSVGTQKLSYLRVPIGMHLIGGNHKSRVRADFSYGLNTYLLQSANYTPNPSPFRPNKPTVADNTTNNFHKIGLGTYVGMGMHIKIGAIANLILNAQVSTAVYDQKKSASVQGYPMTAYLTSITFNAGFQFKICSWRKRWLE